MLRRKALKGSVIKKLNKGEAVLVLFPSAHISKQIKQREIFKKCFFSKLTRIEITKDFWPFYWQWYSSWCSNAYLHLFLVLSAVYQWLWHYRLLWAGINLIVIGFMCFTLGEQFLGGNWVLGGDSWSWVYPNLLEFTPLHCYCFSLPTICSSFGGFPSRTDICLSYSIWIWTWFCAHPGHFHSNHPIGDLFHALNLS